MSATSPSSDGNPSEGQEAESSKSVRKPSCAECHRLKLRCDKKVPCGSCVRRGCEIICPTGTLRSTGRGKRSVMSEVPELTAVIAEMGDRIRQLEQAVASTHEGRIKHPLLSQPSRPSGSSTPAQNGETLGSLSINEAGHSVYFGPTAGTEALLNIEGASRVHSPSHERLSFKTVTDSFPFSSVRGTQPNWDAEKSLEQLYLYLPQESRAWTLVRTYFQNGCWTSMPLLQDEAVDLLTQLYQPYQNQYSYTGTGADLPRPTARLSRYQVAAVYLIFALGALVDLELPEYSPEAEHYFDLACAVISIKSIFEEPTVLTVQTLTLLASYYAHGGRRFSMDAAWAVISLASCVAQRLGMHRESYGAKLPPKLAYRCRALFWETYSVEVIYGLSVGRPTGTFLADISCPMPPDDDDASEPFIKLNRGYRQARWDWTKEVTGPIMETFLTTAKPSYETVLDLDQRIRRYLLSSPFESFVVPDGPSTFIQRNLIPLFSTIMLMYIHSGSFVEAMRDNPANPLASAYAASFLAGYRSASEIIKADIRNFTTYPGLFTRWWAIWKSLFNAAIIVGTVATRYPSSKMAPHAIVELFTAVDLIEKGAVSSGRAQSGLAILQRLRNKAIAVYSQYSGHNLSPPPTADPQTEEELEIFAGYTRVVANKVLRRGVQRQQTPQQSPSTAQQDISRSTSASPSSQWQQPIPGTDPPSRYTPNVDISDIPREFDPAIVRYFDEAAPFANSNMPPLSFPQHHGDGAVPALEDAGFFFTFSPSMAAAAAAEFTGVSAGDFALRPATARSGASAGGAPSASTLQEMQWAEFLQTL